jgi:arsenate reductase-like glutaredoxin family protein
MKHLVMTSMDFFSACSTTALTKEEFQSFLDQLKGTFANLGQAFGETFKQVGEVAAQQGAQLLQQTLQQGAQLAAQG